MPPESAFELCTFKPDSAIFYEGQIGEEAYLIRSGLVEIRKKTSATTETSLGTRGKGQIVGEMALLGDGTRTATAYTLERTEAIKISRDEFLNRVETLDSTMRAIILHLAERLRDASQDLAAARR